MVEDNEINRRIFVKLLKMKGLNCDVAINGEEAVRASADKSYDIIFMDCQMPVMDGYEATRQIRIAEGDRKHTAIIAMTAYAMSGDAENCLESGMDAYLAKPVNFEQVAKMLRKYGKAAAGENNDTDGINCYSQTVADLMEESGFDEETCVELLQGFCEHAKNLIYELQENIIKNRFENARVLLYQLKGSSGSMRVKEISKLAFEAEEALGTSDNEKLKSMLREVKKILDTLNKKERYKVKYC
jgi:CheY-like chemotaxis protein